MSEEDTESDVPEESEFDAAFDEIADEREGREPEDEADDSDDQAGDDSEDADDQDAEQASDGDEEEESDEEPDPYEGMSEAAKAKFIALEQANADLKHKVESDRGRVSAFQRKAQQLEAEIQEIRQGPTSGPQPTSADIAEAMRGTDEDWEQFSEDYPEIARAIDRRFEQTGTRTAEAVEKTLKPVTERQAKADADAVRSANEQRVAAVAEQYPGWVEAVQTDDFTAWLEDQTPGTQGLAESDDPRDAMELLGKYDAYRVEHDLPALRAETPTDPAEPGVENEDAPDKDEPSELARRRAQQLEDGAAPPSKRAGIDADAEPTDEFEAAFEAFAARKERKRA